MTIDIGGRSAHNDDMTPTIRNFPATYDALERFMGLHTHKIICNNTMAEKVLGAAGDRMIWVSLHGHHIATLWEDGGLFIRDAGWQTSITKQRLNHILDANNSSWRIGQVNFRWSLYNWRHTANTRQDWMGEYYASEKVGA